MTDSWRQLADKHNTTIEEIKEQLPLEWVVAVAAGVHLIEAGEGRTHGICPFHADENPSLDIYGYGDRWGCFPCGRGGDVFDFIGDYWELDSFPARFEKALQLLNQYRTEDPDWKGIIEKAGPIKPVTVVELAGEVQAAWDVMKRQTAKPITDLLERKGIAEIDVDWLQRTWRVGVTTNGEVLAPYWDVEQGLVTYKTRAPGRGGWYARRGGKLTSFYGEHQMVGAQAEADVWITEGETDTWLASWLLRGRGIAVGLPSGAGSHIRDEWVELLRNKRVVLCFDADKAGRTAAQRWWQRLHGIAREVTITFPESDLCESRDPMGVLDGGQVVTSQSGFIAPRADGSGYQVMNANGPGEDLSNWVFEATKKIDYRDTLGSSVMNGFEGYYADQAGKIVRVKSTDFLTAQTLRGWAVEHGRSWYGSNAKHPQALLSHLQAMSPFLKEEIAVPVAGLWGHETGHSVFVLPRGSGGSIGSAIGRERWSFAEGMSKYDIGERYVLQARKDFDVEVLKALMQMNIPAVTTPVIAWMMAAPLRKLVREFPPLAVLGGSGSGKTSMTLAFMKLFWGWQGSEQNLTNSTPYAVKQASAASNAMPMWWDEYRRGAREDTFRAVGQVIRDSWTGGVSTRGGMGEDLSRIEITAAIAPLVLSGEAGLEERSHQDRVIVVRLGKIGRNEGAFEKVMDDVAATGGGLLGRRVIEWQLEKVDQRDPLVALGAPLKRDRQEQGVAVLEWGWEMWKAFCRDDFGVEIGWDLDLSVVRAQREGLDENPEITALLEAVQSRAREAGGNDVPVAWVESFEDDLVAVRTRAFYRWAQKAGYVLPGGETATIELLKERFGHVGDRATFSSVLGRKQVRAWRLTGLLHHALEVGVVIEEERIWGDRG